MKYIKLECECGCEFLVAENEYFIENYDQIIQDVYSCPLCGILVPTDECETEVI
jgi:hypothetical protein